MLNYIKNNKKIFGIGFLFLVILILIIKKNVIQNKFILKKKVIINEDNNVIIEFDNKEFIRKDAFEGHKNGYVYKNDEKGLGYYKDK